MERKKPKTIVTTSHGKASLFVFVIKFKLDWLVDFFFISVVRPFQDYFSSYLYETGQTGGGVKTGEPREKPPQHLQAELGLSQMRPEWGSNPHQTQQ